MLHQSTLAHHASRTPTFPPLPGMPEQQPAPWRPAFYFPRQDTWLGGRHAASCGNTSIGHGPGTRRNEGTSEDLGTDAPGSNLTGLPATQEPEPRAGGQGDDGPPRTAREERQGPAQPRT